MPIVAKYSEKYTAFIIICRNEIDENHIAEKLDVNQAKCYKSNGIGLSYVIDAKTFIEKTK